MAEITKGLHFRAGLGLEETGQTKVFLHSAESAYPRVVLQVSRVCGVDKNAKA